MLVQSRLTLCTILAPTRLFPGFDDHGQTGEVHL